MFNVGSQFDEDVIPWLALFLPLLAALSSAARAAVIDIVLNKKRGERVWGRILGKSQSALWAFRVVQGWLVYAPFFLVACIPAALIKFENRWGSNDDHFNRMFYAVFFYTLVAFIMELIRWRSVVAALRALSRKIPYD